MPVTLILVIVGLSHGMVDDSKRRAAGVGADIIIRPPKSSAMSFSGTTIPEQLVAKLAARPHVVGSMGTVNETAGGLFDTLTGIDSAAMKRMSGGFTFEKGRDLRDPDDILLDSYYAEQRHADVGRKLKVVNRDWNVVGIVEPGKLSHMFCDIKVLQDLYNFSGLVSVVYIKVDRPENIESVKDGLKTLLPDYEIYRMEDFTALCFAG